MASVGAKTYVAKNSKIWTEPNRFGEAIAELKAGLPVEVLDYDASRIWVLVRTPSGREGWMPLRFTSQDSRRTQPMISHKVEKSDRAPASSFEETVEAEEKAEKVGESSTASRGPAMDFSLGYSNQLSVENAHGLGLGVSISFEIDSDFYWGAGLNWKLHSKSVTGTCFTDNECQVSRQSQRIYPSVHVQMRKSAFALSANLGLAWDHTGITTKNLTTGVIEQTDDSGNKLTGSGNEFRLGFGVRAAYTFRVGASMALGPYVDYDLDLALSDGSGEFAGTASGKVFHYFGGGVLLQTVF